MSDLADRLKGAIEEKLAIARAAGGECPAWDIRSVPPFTDPLLLGSDGDMYYTTLGTVDLDEPQREHIAAHDPAWAVRQHEAALRVLERHRPVTPNASTSQYHAVHELFEQIMPTEQCLHGRSGILVEFYPWPCPEIRDLADAYGVPVDTEEETRG